MNNLSLAILSVLQQHCFLYLFHLKLIIWKFSKVFLSCKKKWKMKIKMTMKLIFEQKSEIRKLGRLN